MRADLTRLGLTRMGPAQHGLAHCAPHTLGLQTLVRPAYSLARGFKTF